jgi:hypothetical protein
LNVIRANVKVIRATWVVLGVHPGAFEGHAGYLGGP